MLPLPRICKRSFDLGRWFYVTVLGGNQMKYLPSDGQNLRMWKFLKASRENERRFIEQNALLQKTIDDLTAAKKEAETAKKTQEEMQSLLNQAQQAANVLEFSEEETRLNLSMLSWVQLAGKLVKINNPPLK